jgi:hemerythrin-like domain-containing protein
MTQISERVDTWEMVVVHRVFRREFRLLPSLIQGVDVGDTARAVVVAEHLGDMTYALHHHHSGEDDLLWPPLLQRVTLHVDLVHSMEAQHERMALLLDRVEALLPRWRARGDAATRDELASLVVQVSAALDEHLAEEENKILPLVSEYLTQAEWHALGERGKKSLPKGTKGFVFLGAILKDATPTERVAFLALLPLPVRVLWRLFGAGIYRRATDRLHNTA